MRRYALTIVRYSGRILLGRKRSTFKAVNGESPWVIPGGTIEAKDQTPLAAAQRELSEEIGKEIAAQRFKELGVVTDCSRGCEYHIFSVALSAGEFRENPPAHKEFTGFKWVFLEEIPWVEMLPEHEEWLPRMLFATQPLTFSVNEKPKTV